MLALCVRWSSLLEGKCLLCVLDGPVFQRASACFVRGMVESFFMETLCVCVLNCSVLSTASICFVS